MKLKYKQALIITYNFLSYIREIIKNLINKYHKNISPSALERMSSLDLFSYCLIKGCRIDCYKLQLKTKFNMELTQSVDGNIERGEIQFGRSKEVVLTPYLGYVYIHISSLTSGRASNTWD